MKKRGQIGFFLVVALIFIIGVVSLYLMLSNKTKNYVSGLDYSTVDPVKNYVTFCLEDSAREGLVYAGMNGGYIYLPVDLQRLSVHEDLKLSVLYSVGRNRLLPLPEIERQMGVYLKERMSYCLNYETFTKQKFTIKEDLRNISQSIKSRFRNISVRIDEESVSVELEYPLTIEKDGKVYKLERFSGEVPIRFGLIHKIANETINNIALSDATPRGQLEKSFSPYLNVQTGYSLGFILDSYDEVDVSYYIFDQDVSVWSIYDDYGGNDYRFSFAALHVVKGQ